MRSIIECLNNNDPTAVAAICEEEKITYGEILEKAYIIASNIALLSRPKSPIIVFMDKGIDALVSFFGILTAGSFYCFLNPELPLERLKKIVNILDSKIIITNATYYETALKLSKSNTIFKYENLISGVCDKALVQSRLDGIIDTDPMYVNFTSGSTGVPKGVLVSHRSVVDFIDVFTKEFKLQATDVFANQAPFDFDVSVKDIYSSLYVGGTILLIPKRFFSNPSKLLCYLDDNRATTLIWAVSALCLITTFHGLDYKVPKCINKIMFSGEVMPLNHLNIWTEHYPDALFVNLYGPTEITCNCTYHVIDKKRTYTKIPIGKSFLNERVFLLDSDSKEIIDDNIVGEICVSGSCLALGYYNNPEATDLHFVNNPSNTNYRELIYKTGDLGYYLDGELYFKGRADFQIKYLGHRIELEEIENNMNLVPGVIRSICLFDEIKSRLYAFYVGDVSVAEIKEFLAEKIPTYMIPPKMIKLDAMPLTKNGKIDRAKLKEKNEVAK